MCLLNLFRFDCNFVLEQRHLWYSNLRPSDLLLGYLNLSYVFETLF